MSSPKDPAVLVTDPEWFPSHWDPAANKLQFVRLPREAHAQLTFLSDEYLQPLGLAAASASFAELATSVSPQGAAPQYIFHSAFAASTLLTRALDAPGVALGLKEPQVLNDAADALRRRALPANILEGIVRLLARPMTGTETVVVKPSNVANLLAPALIDCDARSQAIFLYAPLARFLRSVAEKGLWGRRWARRLFPVVSGDTGLNFGLSAAEQFELTDLQIAALAWLMHHAQGASLIARYPDRVRALDSETFLAQRAETIAAVAKHFGLGIIENRAEEIATGPAFATHSKEIGRSFDPEEPLRAKASIPLLDDEIAMVAEWTAAVAGHAGVPMQFSAPATL